MAETFIYLTHKDRDDLMAGKAKQVRIFKEEELKMEFGPDFAKYAAKIKVTEV